jgi:hypothetical protein
MIKVINAIMTGMPTNMLPIMYDNDEEQHAGIARTMEAIVLIKQFEMLMNADDNNQQGDSDELLKQEFISWIMNHMEVNINDKMIDFLYDRMCSNILTENKGGVECGSGGQQGKLSTIAIDEYLKKVCEYDVFDTA